VLRTAVILGELRAEPAETQWRAEAGLS
jgi:hypothetical protein